MESAVSNGELEVVRSLLQTNPSTPINPLLFLTTDPEIIKLLLLYGADPTIPDEYGFRVTDYIDDPQVVALFTAGEPKSAKFIKYRGTYRAKANRAKTRRKGPPAAILE